MTPRGHRVDVDLYTAAGAAFVVVGGLVAAVASPLDLAKGSWLAAYLVLVCGVALIVIGVAQQQLTTAVPTPMQMWQLAGWGVSNALVIAGSLSSIPLITDAGSIVLFATLVLTAWLGRGLLGARRAAGYVYITVLIVLAVSVPIGSVLAHARA
ncbi:hypothetical protein L5G32_01525 [Gordonia sp. HY002]|uniref:hypothetical protein n=1 Tax=Gordonia zhenghanii TaxID=2911516 RepID=UPI001EEFCBE4|nr:hypothetical protein [Gordonia zhenghanii]MCF8568946.1 hypothetical protein [Gordonia zhenghanii]MCF8603041.1 hypothetical protein [Gordonia zhenghanii]